MSWRDGSKEMSWIGAEHVPISAFLEEEVQMHCYHFSMLWIQQGSFESIILCHLQESVPGQCSSDVLKYPMVTKMDYFWLHSALTPAILPSMSYFRSEICHLDAGKTTLVLNNITTVVVEEKVSGLYFLVEISHWITKQLSTYCFHGSLYTTPCKGETS